MINKKEWFLKQHNQIYCFTDSVSLCKKLLSAGARIIQFRNKTLDNHVFYRIGKEIQSLIKSYQDIIFIINDRVDIAMQLKVDGIHIGQGDAHYPTVIKQAPAHMIIGVSVDNEEEAVTAEKAGASYVGAGSVFPTQTKEDVPVIGISGLKKIVDAVNIPVVAIGGISAGNITEVKKTGAQYYGIVSQINNAPDTQGAFKNLFRRMNRGNK